MTADRLRAELLTVGDLHEDPRTVYTIPVYQRNYAWRAEQIEQLLSDVRDAMGDHAQNYFLGNLIVTERGAGTADYEVIDGQQRLTTLYLLLTDLAGELAGPGSPHSGRLRYQSRPRAAEALRRIEMESSRTPGATAFLSSAEDTGIEQGFNVIRQYLRQHLRNPGDRVEYARFLESSVTLVRAVLPERTDLNRYFEVMNTRGQQLHQVDIVKAHLMGRLADETERACFAWIWNACAQMDSYVQMALTPGDTELRTQLFGTDWSHLTAPDFGNLCKIFSAKPRTGSTDASSGTPLTLDQALAKYSATATVPEQEDAENVRFRSTIEFPVLLMHVLKVLVGDARETEGHLDDKNLIKRFKEHFPKGGSEQVQRFVHTLLLCRNLFDTYVLKRQYTGTYTEEGEWSLQRFIRRTSKGKSVPGYVNTFQTEVNTEEDGDVDPATDDALLLQSMLRITYTSPRTMHWVTEVLSLLADPQHPAPERELAPVLRDYARGKVREAYFGDAAPTGFDINRIVFTYLDYLIATDGPRGRSGFRFSFRNSLEHFYPQYPHEEMTGSRVKQECLHLLGNLALVSVGANSKFSNSLPRAKAENYRHTIERQSLKLQLMAQITRAEGWGDEQVLRHHKHMVGLLRRDLGLPKEPDVG